MYSYSLAVFCYFTNANIIQIYIYKYLTNRKTPIFDRRCIGFRKLVCFLAQKRAQKGEVGEQKSKERRQTAQKSFFWASNGFSDGDFSRNCTYVRLVSENKQVTRSKWYFVWVYGVLPIMSHLPPIASKVRQIWLFHLNETNKINFHLF